MNWETEILPENTTPSALRICSRTTLHKVGQTQADSPVYNRIILFCINENNRKSSRLQHNKPQASASCQPQSTPRIAN